MIMDKWDKRFIDLAQFISNWSKDTTQVGAVLSSSKGNDFICTGFNGFPENIQDDSTRLSNRDIKYDLMIHAEINCLRKTSADLTGCTLYTYPLPPCVRCATEIIQRKISRVVSLKCSNPRWIESTEKAKELFKEAKIIFETLD